MMLKNRFYFLLFWMTLAIAPLAKACPHLLKKLNTAYLDQTSLCQIFDNYHKTLNQLKARGVKNPERIAELMAPRFINRPDWLQARATNNFNPMLIYKPAPLTWTQWEDGAELIENLAKKNFSNKKMEPITTDWILKIHTAMMKNITAKPGEFRKVADYGLFLRKETAISIQHFNGLKKNSPSLFKSWHPTLCLENHDPEFIEDIESRRRQGEPWFYLSDWRDISPNQFYIGAKGRKMQCGYLSYLSANELKNAVHKMLANINKQTQLWPSSRPTEDPLLSLAKFQKRFVQIHPFEDGNGRVSRILMDYFILSLGLPPPIFLDMDDDIYSSDQQWAKEIGDGMLRGLSLLKSCAHNPNIDGCRPIKARSF